MDPAERSEGMEAYMAKNERIAELCAYLRAEQGRLTGAQIKAIAVLEMDAVRMDTKEFNRRAREIAALR